jgi:DNA-directed RNA polymerase specialized sigma24 family protein
MSETRRYDDRILENILSQHQIIQLLEAWSGGDQAALDQLIPLVYNELRRMAAGYLRRRGAQNSLQPTSIVHEVYLRVLGQRDVHFENRGNFSGWRRI